MGISVLVADAQPLLAETLAITLGLYGDIDVLPDCALVAEDAVELANDQRPDVLLLDYWISGMEGPKFSTEVLGQIQHSRVVLLSWFQGTHRWFDPAKDIEEALRAGATGFLPKSLRVNQIVNAVRLAHEGKKPIYPELLEDLKQKMTLHRIHGDEKWQQLARLTGREREILELLAQGYRVEQVAKALYLSPATLRTHVNRILEKTGTHSQMEAVAIARKLGLIRT